MLCEKCKVNQANVKYSQNINGVKVDYNLCDSCFNLLKINNSFIDNFFNSFFCNLNRVLRYSSLFFKSYIK